MKSWEKVGIIPNFENVRVKNMKIDSFEVLNDINFVDGTENSTFYDPLGEKRENVKKLSWGFINEKELKISMKNKCPLCNSDLSYG